MLVLVADDSLVRCGSVRQGTGEISRQVEGFVWPDACGGVKRGGMGRRGGFGEGEEDGRGALIN